MEQQQNQNHFYEIISNYLKTQENISDRIKNISGNEDLTVDEFTLLGSIGFMIGLEFTSQRGLVWSSLARVNKRLTENNVTKENFVDLIRKLETLNLDLTNHPKEKIKSKINLPVANQVICVAIKDILKNSIIGVEYSQEVNALLTKKITYHDILKFNTLFYENLEVSGTTANNVINLLSSPDYRETMQFASEAFDEQKYAIIYQDSIITLREFMGATHEIPVEEMLFDDELIERLKIKEQEAEEMEEEVEQQQPQPESEVGPQPESEEMISPEETDKFLKLALEDVLERKIETADDLFDAFEMVKNSEAVLEQFYRFVKMKATFNRVEFETVYPFSNEELKTKLEEHIDSNNTRYKELVERYAQPLNDAILIEKLNQTIRSLSLDNKDAKIFLFQQLAENQIETFKHLHQIISVIENSKIYVSKLKAYVDLKEYVEKNKEITTVFGTVGEINDITNNINWYSAIHKFFIKSVEPTEMEQEFSK